MTTLKPLNRQTAPAPHAYTERIVQFGAGNFLRGFVGWIIEKLNVQTDFGAGVVVVKVTPNGRYDALEQQDGLFHVYLEGIEHGKPVNETTLITHITRVVYPYEDYAAYVALAHQPEIRFLISNTTEAGIIFEPSDSADAQPPSSFPAKLTLFLWERYQHFAGAADKGCIILPTELVIDNGTQLREMVLRYAQQWGLAAGFSAWIVAHNTFCNTLVDRIVSGFPSHKSAALLAKLGYNDVLLVMGEPYHLWVIEAPLTLEDEFPVAKALLNIPIVSDVSPYRETKVRILNGIHSAIVPIGYLMGLRYVHECVEFAPMERFMQALISREIIPSIALSTDVLTLFATSMFDRFRNPSIAHALMSIAVNSSTKFRTRLVPTLKDYHAKFKQLPRGVVLAFAAFIVFYRGEWQGESIALNDDPAVLAWFRQQWEHSADTATLTEAVLGNMQLWGENLMEIDGLHAQICQDIHALQTQDIAMLLQDVNG